MTATLTTRLVERASGVLDRRSDRRGFLRKSALVGSAMVAAPADFVLRPTTAFAAICSCNGSSCDCGALCCDGYTEFCCTINGQNGCPPGTLYGGWWKVDGSNFCVTEGQPGPRYYLDCNAPCGDCGCGPSGICPGSCSGTPCGCANGSCHNRKAGCTGFRYGQCNQHVPCLGPIVCRVVTCTAPWRLDQSCTTAVRTDNNTRYHNAPCLQNDPGNPDGSVESVELAPGGVRVIGYVLASVGRRVRLTVGTGISRDIRANKNAADVGRVEPSGASVRWFDGVVPAPAGTQIVCASSVSSAGARVVGCRPIVVPGHQPFGAIEGVFGGAKSLRVIGWAIDPDTAGPVNVFVSVDGKVVKKARANVERADLAGTYPNFGTAHGFDIEVPAGRGARQICVSLANRKAGSGQTLLGCEQAVVPSGSPFGSLDSVTAVPDGALVEGWAIDPDLDGPAKVTISVDGQAVETVTADARRPEVGVAHPGFGDEHGFSALVRVPEGTHEVCVKAADRGPGRARRLGCSSVTIESNVPVGAIDTVSVLPGRVRVRGWAVDPDVAHSVEVQVRVDGTVLLTELATLRRGDVGAAFPFHGPEHGFDLGVDAAPGAHEVTVIALDGSGQGSTVLGSRMVEVP